MGWILAWLRIDFRGVLEGIYKYPYLRVICYYPGSNLIDGNRDICL